MSLTNPVDLITLKIIKDDLFKLVKKTVLSKAAQEIYSSTWERLAIQPCDPAAAVAAAVLQAVNTNALADFPVDVNGLLKRALANTADLDAMRILSDGYRHDGYATLLVELKLGGLIGISSGPNPIQVVLLQTGPLWWNLVPPL